MLSYDELVEVCSRSNLDPKKRGKNIWATSSPMGQALFDLKTIDFPENEFEQIQKIGELINNVFSQKTSGVIEFNSKEDRDNNAIEKIVPMAEESINCWLKEGLKKSKKPKNSLFIHNGKVHESNPELYKQMQEMDDELMEFRREFKLKQARSERSGRDIILRSKIIKNETA